MSDPHGQAPIYLSDELYRSLGYLSRSLQREGFNFIVGLEAALISTFDARNPEHGYNTLPGGEFNPSQDPAIAKRVGLKLRGRKNPEHVRLKKQICWTPERRAAESARHKGKVISESHKAALRAAAERRRGGPKPPQRDHKSAALAQWQRVRDARMSEAEAVKFWRDHNLTISDAIQCMTGWTEGAAISVFGRRYIQPKRKHFI